MPSPDDIEFGRARERDLAFITTLTQETHNVQAMRSALCPFASVALVSPTGWALR